MDKFEQSSIRIKEYYIAIGDEGITMDKCKDLIITYYAQEKATRLIYLWLGARSANVRFG